MFRVSVAVAALAVAGLVMAGCSSSDEIEVAGSKFTVNRENCEAFVAAASVQMATQADADAANRVVNACIDKGYVSPIYFDRYYR